MGCAASTSAHPAYPAPTPNAAVAQRQQHPQHQQRSPPSLPVAQVQQLSRQREAARDSVKSAPLVKSLVSLQRERCAVERDQQGCHFRFYLNASASGEANVFFLASGDDLASSFETPRAEQALSQRFEAGKSQSCRLFICRDLKQSLEECAGDQDVHQLVLDLRVDSSDTQCITAQRSFVKFGDGDAPQVVKQLVQCGTSVRSLDALYGTLPNPRRAARDSGISAGNSEQEGGDCVICLNRPREVVILHCRHVCLCTSCAQITSSTWSHQCPVCRGRVAAMVGLDEAGSKG